MKPSEMLKLWESKVDVVEKEAHLRDASGSRNCEHCKHWQPSNMQCHVLSQKAGSLVITRKDEVCDYFKKIEG